MNAGQSRLIVELLRQGSQFILDDSDDSKVIRMRYDELSGTFVYHQTDTLVGRYFPDENYPVDLFMEFLEQNYEYEEFLRHTYKRPQEGSVS
jgi:hypothetical protein